MPTTKTTSNSKDVSIRPALRELERLWHCFKPLFSTENPMHPPIITIQSTNRKPFLGWYWADKWDAKGGLVSELNISAEFLNRDVFDICETLIHEMAHQANHVDGIKDCSDTQYHNKRFKLRAETAGLEVEQLKGKGWAKTSLDEKAKKAVTKAKPDASAFELFRQTTPKKERNPTKMKKWTCECGVNVRCAVILNAACNDCGADFLCEDGDDD